MTEWNFWFLAWGMWYMWNPQNKSQYYSLWLPMNILCLYKMWTLY